MDCKERNRIVSLDDMEKFFSNFKCQQCLSLGSYIITNELQQWIDHSINVTFKCKICSMSLVLKESFNIEIQTPGCISKTISRNLIQFAHAATVIGLSFAQIENLLQSLEIPAPTLSIWKTSVEIASGGIKSCFTDQKYPHNFDDHVELPLTSEARSGHASHFMKSEEASKVADNNLSYIMIKEEPPDEVITPDALESVLPLDYMQQLSQQVTKEDPSEEVAAATGIIETIYIQESNSQADFTSSSSQDGCSDDEIKYQCNNANEFTQNNRDKKRRRHINTPKRYREDFYCEEVCKKIRSKKKYALINRVENDENLITDNKINRIVQKNNNPDLVNNEKTTSNIDNSPKFVSEIRSSKEIEYVENFDSVNNAINLNNVENISSTNFDIFDIICALCGSICNYSREKYSYSSLVIGFESITVKVAMQILNLLSNSNNPKCQNVCTSCFRFICSKFKFTLRKKIAEEKKIDISKVDLSKIRVRMFDYNDKKNNKTRTFANSKATVSPSTSCVPSLQYNKLMKFNSANKIKLRRIKHLSKKKDESLTAEMLKNPTLTQKLVTEAISFHPIIRLMDISPILPSEAFLGASVLVNSKSDISQFC